MLKINSNSKHCFVYRVTLEVFQSFFVKNMLAIETQQINVVIEALTIAQIALVGPAKITRMKGRIPLSPREAKMIMATARIVAATKQAAKNRGPNPKAPCVRVDWANFFLREETSVCRVKRLFCIEASC